ncbi:MAG: peptidoglycan bridge formation glycyltransferase FemA/FemB family protein [Microbacteriaceae bacterium]|nr:peptidoglycan bridge formation glycyltransferase FemA/FemB family protein [Microbacteriaceae bacterium]
MGATAIKLLQLSDRDIDAQLQTAKEWDSKVLSCQDKPHFTQSYGWGLFRGCSPWRPERHSIQVGDSPYHFQTLSRTAPFIGELILAPRLSGVNAEVAEALTSWGKTKKSIKRTALKVDFNQPNTPMLTAPFASRGWKRGRTVHYMYGVSVNIPRTEDELLASYKKRARYEVKQGQKAGVSIRRADYSESDAALLISMMNLTQKRTGAYFHNEEYLNLEWRILNRLGYGDFWFAEYEGETLAGAFVLRFGNRAWYREGGSTRTQPKIFAARYLQHAIMTDLVETGHINYDLGNIPRPWRKDKDPSSNLWAFKTGFSEEFDFYAFPVELPLGPAYKWWHLQEENWLRMNNLLHKEAWY